MRGRPARNSLLVALALGLLAPGCRRRQAPAAAAKEEAPAAAARTAAEKADEPPVRVLYPAAPGSFVELTAELAPSIVHLASDREVSGGAASLLPMSEPSKALGSGFVVEVAGKSFIVTSDHVVAGATELRAILSDGTELAARIVGRDLRLDVALLEVDPSPKLTPAPLGKSELARPGEWVAALGNPLGGGVTVSAGLLSARWLSAEGELLRSEGPALRSFLVTDASIHAGNSGGPLINMAGEVIGINTAVEKTPRGVGFAVPMDRARQILPMLEEEGRVVRAWLGAKIHPVTAELAGQLELPSEKGALISEVIGGGPAAKAGLDRGDVILSYDGRAADHRSLPWLVATSGLGAKPVVVWRDGAEKHVTVVAEKMPE